MSARPPRLARRILAAFLPHDQHEGVIGDLDEVHARRAAGGSALAAWIWYWGQALWISARFAVEDLADRARVTASSASLDLRLGVRMLLKYPMLTVVGGLAITIGAAVGVGASEFVRDMLFSELPLEDDDRIVRIVNDGAGQGLYDFLLWKDELESVGQVSAARWSDQGILTADRRPAALQVAQVSASTFPVTGVEPLLGRTLTEADEREGAPDVVVLGWEAWQELFGGDTGALGEVVQLGGVATTVVGVMPEGYGFPQSAEAWAPFRYRAVDAIPGGGPGLLVFGKLADGASLEQAQAEVRALGERMAADHPETYERSTAHVGPFGTPVGAEAGLVTLILQGLRLLLVVLLAIPCLNVATLVFARTITREGEIAVRMSLGATRKRIVLQLLAEALVLVSVSTVLALALARWVLGKAAATFFMIQQEPTLPFGWNHSLSPQTILYAGVLALAGALVVGVVPALKATRGDVKPKLSELSTGSGSRLRFGGMWTAIIVFQVALSVAFLPIAVNQAGAVSLVGGLEELGGDETFPADQYVTAQLGRDQLLPLGDDAARAEFLEESRLLFQEVKARIAADPRVESVAFASGLSAMNHLVSPVEIPAEAGSPPTAAAARILLVEPEYLEMMNATVVAGRGLQAADFAEGSRAVLVNEAFVEGALAGRNAVGAQLRFPEREGESSLIAVPAPGESVEVVGVVANPEIDVFGPGAHSVIYAPLSLAPVASRAVGLVEMPEAPATQIFVRLRPGSEPITTLLYDVIAAVDPTLRVSQLYTVEDAWAPVHEGARIFAYIFMAVAAIVLMLAAAGVYALMSFTVSQRTREIAIRLAVGAAPRQIAFSIFRRAFIQLGVGVALGLVVAWPAIGDAASGDPKNVLIAVLVLMGAGLASCLLPIRRALRIEPAAAVKTG